MKQKRLPLILIGLVIAAMYTRIVVVGFMMVLPYVSAIALISYIGLSLAKYNRKLTHVNFNKLKKVMGNTGLFLFKLKRVRWMLVVFAALSVLMNIEYILHYGLITLIVNTIILALAALAWKGYAVLMLKKHGEVVQSFRRVLKYAAR